MNIAAERPVLCRPGSASRSSRVSRSGGPPSWARVQASEAPAMPAPTMAMSKGSVSDIARSYAAPWRRSAAPARHQRLPLGPHRGQVAGLDVAEAADVLGQAGDLQGQGQLVGAQAVPQFVHGGAVVGEQGAFLDPLGVAAEGV